MTIFRALLVLPLMSLAVAQSSPTCCPKSPTTGKEAALWHKLETEVREIDARLDAVMGVAIEDLSNGRTLFLNPDEIFPQASSIKIAMLAELYHQHQEGKLKLDDLYTVNAADLIADSNIMGGLTPGVTRITNRGLATMMIAVSDNSATNVLIDPRRPPKLLHLWAPQIPPPD